MKKEKKNNNGQSLSEPSINKGVLPQSDRDKALEENYFSESDGVWVNDNIDEILILEKE